MTEILSTDGLVVGAQRSAVVVSDLKRTQIVMYAGASSDFNPLHTDEPFATKIAGNPTVMAHGMLTMGLAGQVLTDWFGHDNLGRYRARFLAPVWPGDTITVTATVTAIEAQDDRTLAEISLSATTGDPAVVVLTGTATADISPEHRDG